MTREAFNSSAACDQAMSHNTSTFNNADYELMAAAVHGRDSSLSDQSLTEAEESYRKETKSKSGKKKRPTESNDDKLSVV